MADVTEALEPPDTPMEDSPESEVVEAPTVTPGEESSVDEPLVGDPADAEDTPSPDGDASLTEARMIIQTGRYKSLTATVRLPVEREAEMGHLLARKRREMQQLELKRKAESAKLAAQVKKLNARLDQIAADLEANVETIQVQCELVYDFTNGVAEYRRLSDGYPMQSRSLTDEERQMQLQIDEDRHPDDREGLSDEDSDALDHYSEGSEEEGDEREIHFTAAEMQFDAFLTDVRIRFGEIDYITVHPRFMTFMGEILRRNSLASGEEKPEYWPNQAILSSNRLWGKSIIVDGLLDRTYLLSVSATSSPSAPIVAGAGDGIPEDEDEVLEEDEDDDEEIGDADPDEAEGIDE